MAASRSRRVNAGSLMASLMKDFHEEETFNTLYGGFTEEIDDQDFGLEAASDDGSDTDFDEEEEELVDDIKEAPEDEDESKRKRKKPAKKTPGVAKRKPAAALPTPLPAKRKRFSRLLNEDTLISEDDDELDKHETLAGGEDTSSGDKDDSKGATSSPVPGGTEAKAKRKKAMIAPSNRSIRDSTAAKRFETEELEMQRVLRRQEIGPRKKTKHRIPTQTERLTKSLATEKANRADLAKYEKDEEENEKKRTRKMKVVRGPFDICTISTTRALPTIDEAPNARAQELLKEAESIIGHKPGEKYTRSLLCFKTEDLFKQAFPDQVAPPLPEYHPCMVTGKPAKYFDPITRQYYYDCQALNTLRQVIYRHLIGSPTYLSDSKVMKFVRWYEAKYKTSLREGDVSDIGTHDYSPNIVSQPVNGTNSSTSVSVS